MSSKTEELFTNSMLIENDNDLLLGISYWLFSPLFCVNSLKRFGTPGVFVILTFSEITKSVKYNHPENGIDLTLTLLSPQGKFFCTALHKTTTDIKCNSSNYTQQGLLWRCVMVEGIRLFAKQTLYLLPESSGARCSLSGCVASCSIAICVMALLSTLDVGRPNIFAAASLVWLLIKSILKTKGGTMQ